MRTLNRSLAIAVLALTALFVTAIPATSTTVEGPSFNQCNGQWWSQDICKYDQSSTVIFGLNLDMYAKGATASGPCDPSNNVWWTKSGGNRIYQNGSVIAGYGGSGQWTNCSIPGGAQWAATRALDSGTLTIDYFFSYSVGGVVTAAALNGHWVVSP